jgi:hypothetical protein
MGKVYSLLHLSYLGNYPLDTDVFRGVHASAAKELKKRSQALDEMKAGTDEKGRLSAAYYQANTSTG